MQTHTASSVDMSPDGKQSFVQINNNIFKIHQWIVTVSMNQSVVYSKPKSSHKFTFETQSFQFVKQLVNSNISMYDFIYVQLR